MAETSNVQTRANWTYNIDSHSYTGPLPTILDDYFSTDDTIDEEYEAPQLILLTHPTIHLHTMHHTLLTILQTLPLATSIPLEKPLKKGHIRCCTPCTNNNRRWWRICAPYCEPKSPCSKTNCLCRDPSRHYMIKMNRS